MALPDDMLMPVLGYDPADEVMVSEVQERQCQEQREIIRALLRTYEGRAFAQMLMDEAGGMFPEALVAGQPDLTGYRLGRNSLGRWAAEWVLTVAPEVFIIMRKEARDRQQRYVDDANKAIEGS